jgi:hypothetical protein
MQMSMFSLVEPHASRSQSQDFERAWLTLEATSLSPSLRSLLSMLPAGSAGRMSLACCQANKEGILEPSSGAWGNAGMGGLTGFSMPNILEFHSAAVACSLSDILETGDVPRRFYLSATACRGILRRAEKRGKELAGNTGDCFTFSGQSLGVAPIPFALKALTQARTERGGERRWCRWRSKNAPSASGNPDNGPQGAGYRTDGQAYTLEARNKVQAICFTAKDHGADASDISPTLRSGSHSGSHANGGVMPAVAFRQTASTAGDGRCLTQRWGARKQRQFKRPDGLLQGSAVRRLTPAECERLQGFPDDYTAVPYRGKPAADGPRYKALGNSMAVPVMRWIGERIAMVEAEDAS